MSRVEVLVACMNQSDDGLYGRMNLQTDAVLANQSDFYGYEEYIQPTEERLEMISALRVVDEAVVYDAISPDFLKTVSFDVLALGEDHVSERFMIAAKWCEENGKEVVRLKRTQGICSSSIKQHL